MHKFKIGDKVQITKGIYQGLTVTITGCFFDKIHGDLPYYSIDLCAAAFYEDALEKIGESNDGR